MKQNAVRCYFKECTCSVTRFQDIVLLLCGDSLLEQEAEAVATQLLSLMGPFPAIRSSRSFLGHHLLKAFWWLFQKWSLHWASLLFTQILTVSRVSGILPWGKLWVYQGWCSLFLECSQYSWLCCFLIPFVVLTSFMILTQSFAFNSYFRIGKCFW